MTLLIACFIIHTTSLSAGWYIVAGVVWLCHVAYHLETKRS